MVGDAGVVSVMAASLMTYHRCLSMSKLRLEVFLDRVLSKLKTSNYFLAFSVESTTLKSPFECFGGMRNCVNDFSWKVWLFSISFVFLDYVDEKKKYILWGPTTYNVIVSQDVVTTLYNEGCVEENNKNSMLAKQIALLSNTGIRVLV